MSSFLGTMVRGIEAPAFTGTEAQKLSQMPQLSAVSENIDPQAIKQAVPQPGRVDHPDDAPTTRDQGHAAKNESRFKAKNDGVPLEERKYDFENGQLIVKVYNNKGKLLRQVPPGYIPLNLSA